jgi:hypothetical protein
MDLLPCRQWARAVNSNSTSGAFSCLAPRWPDRRASGAGILGRPLRQTFSGGRVVVSPGVLSSPPQAKCGGFRGFTAFDAANDLYHDFSRFDLAGVSYVFEVDCYARHIHGSKDTVGTGELTIRRADEY